MEKPNAVAIPFPVKNSERVALLSSSNPALFMRIIISIRCAVKLALQRYLDIFLGAVLVLAGGLKSYQLLTNPSTARMLMFPHELVIGAAVFELALGWFMVCRLASNSHTLAGPGLVHKPCSGRVSASYKRRFYMCLLRSVRYFLLVHVLFRWSGGWRLSVVVAEGSLLSPAITNCPQSLFLIDRSSDRSG